MTTLKDYHKFLGDRIEKHGDGPLNAHGYTSAFYLYTVATEQLRCLNKGMERKNRLIARLREQVKQLKNPTTPQ